MSAFALLAIAAALAPGLGAERSWCLPKTAAETSGLAPSGPRTLLTHDDEHGIVYEVDLDRAAVLRTFALGRPTVADDFEGIATAHGKVWLVTSLGRIYEAGDGADGERVLYNTYDTGLSGRCEAEGLDHDEEADELVIACKRVVREGEGPPPLLVLYRWSMKEKAPLSDPVLVVEAGAPGWEAVARAFPSAIDWLPGPRQYLVASARTNEIFRVGEDGSLLARHALDPKTHDKTEGLALLGDGTLVLSDEKDRACGRISVLEAFPGG